MINNVNFTPDTVEYFLKLYSKYGYENEFSQTLCLYKDKLIEGGEVCVGSSCGVKKPSMTCEIGTPIGDLHSHTEPYFNRAPFDKGTSDIDIFGIVKDGLNKKITFPHLACVFAPVADEKTHKLAGYDITCEQFDEFTEDDIRGIPTGVTTTKEADGKRVEDIHTFGDQEIKYLKLGSPPGGEGGWEGTFKRLGFTMGMAHIKMNLEKKGLMRQDGFTIKLEKKNNKFFVNWDDEKAILFRK